MISFKKLATFMLVILSCESLAYQNIKSARSPGEHFSSIFNKLFNDMAMDSHSQKFSSRAILNADDTDEGRASSQRLRQLSIRYSHEPGHGNNNKTGALNKTLKTSKTSKSSKAKSGHNNGYSGHGHSGHGHHVRKPKHVLKEICGTKWGYYKHLQRIMELELSEASRMIEENYEDNDYQLDKAIERLEGFRNNVWDRG